MKKRKSCRRKQRPCTCAAVPVGGIGLDEIMEAFFGPSVIGIGFGGVLADGQELDLFYNCENSRNV